MEQSGPKRSKKHFPFKKIEKLIEMATKNQLDFLEVDGIKIVPRRGVFPNIQPQNGNSKNGKPLPPLTPLQQENIILFGKPDINESN